MSFASTSTTPLWGWMAWKRGKEGMLLLLLKVLWAYGAILALEILIRLDEDERD